MTDLERFRATMNYQSVDRRPFWVWGPWPETVDRWKLEGYDEAEFDYGAGADSASIYGGWFFPNPPFEREVVHEDDEHILYVNHEGILLRELKNHPLSSMPQFVKFPVETREEFRKFWKERMRPDLTERIGPDWQRQLREIRELPHPFIIISDRWGGFFGPIRNLLGVERLCMLFHDDPAFVEEMMDADADFIIAMMSQILDVATPDAYAFWEDMAYNTAPLISPEMARRYMLPRYKRVTEFLTGRGVKHIVLDSDGRIDSLIPIWLDSGINCLYPFEVQCGMDVLAVRGKYGRDLRIWGGVDKRALAKGPRAIDAELARLRPLIEEGGYIPHTDHSIPPDVSFANYKYYVKRMEEICR
ncbi:MAG: uroporphyrinogen decarboxylase family protein [Armatimonadota bacterium]|nr:uroporphyrinogen decarboxylase family protein [Armatimonadota bacterium]